VEEEEEEQVHVSKWCPGGTSQRPHSVSLGGWWMGIGTDCKTGTDQTDLTVRTAARKTRQLNLPTAPGRLVCCAQRRQCWEVGFPGPGAGGERAILAVPVSFQQCSGKTRSSSPAFSAPSAARATRECHAGAAQGGVEGEVGW
jgi:hypothetical protein